MGKIPLVRFISSLILLAALIGFVYLAIATLLPAILALPREMGTPILTGFFVIAVALVNWALQNVVRKQEAHRVEKIRIYSHYLDMMFKILRGKNYSDDLANDAGFVKEMWDFKKDLMLYGSPRVIKRFNTVQGKHGEVRSRFELVERTGELILAMREDVGLTNWGLSSNEIQLIIVNDDTSIQKSAEAQ